MQINVGIKNLKRGTNITEINVPAALRVRKTAGIDWFDEALGGGFVPSTVHMMTGTPGAGKTTLLLQLAESITRSGHVALYNTGEESLYQVKMVTERIKIKNGFLVGQDTMVSSLLEHADMIRKLNPSKQVFILQDSLQTLNDGKWGDDVNSKTPVRCCEMLTNWAKATYGVVLFIGQVNKDGEFSGKQTIAHAVDGRHKLFVDEDKKSETYGSRIFKTVKNRWGSSGKDYVLNMNDRGLSMGY